MIATLQQEQLTQSPNAEQITAADLITQIHISRNMTNPYESPTEEMEPREPTRCFLTRQRVFWFGSASIFAGVIIAIVSPSGFFDSSSLASKRNAFDLFINWTASICFYIGLIALVFYHWFPDSSRKYSWRRKQLQGKTDLD